MKDLDKIDTSIIKAKIAIKRLTIKEVAEAINVNDQTISNWINNKNIDNINKFLKLLKFLEIDINEIKK